MNEACWPGMPNRDSDIAFTSRAFREKPSPSTLFSMKRSVPSASRHISKRSSELPSAWSLARESTSIGSTDNTRWAPKGSERTKPPMANTETSISAAKTMNAMSSHFRRTAEPTTNWTNNKPDNDRNPLIGTRMQARPATRARQGFVRSMAANGRQKVQATSPSNEPSCPM